uniref:Histone-lysine N-methyltransferase SUVR2 n=1 Tax=Cajanus cajan TaxID=3821 RepID=A0A151U4B2_CAJCA|nr:Histone-lysine N-methyltransferase SUVR2 [Cajanus cajan]
MAPNKRVGAAYRAMASLGVDESKVKSVLKKLLKVYDKNWELIEEENYRVLADAIFEDDDNMVPELKRKSQTVDAHNTHHSLSSSLSNNLEEETECEEAQMHVETARPLKRLPLRGQEIQPLHPSTNSAPSPPSKKFKSEDSGLPGGCSGKKPQNKAVGRRLASERVSPSIPSKEPTVEPGKILLPNNQMSRTHVLLVPKDEPVDELPDYEMPIAVIPPEPSNVRDSSMKNGVAGKHGDHVTMSSSQHRGRVRDEDIPTSNGEATCNVEIASSTLGEVKLSLSCSSALQGSDICDCMLEFRTNSSDDSREGSIIRSGADVSKESQENHGTPNVGEISKMDITDFSQNNGRKEPEGPTSPNSRSLVVVPQHNLTTDDMRSIHDVNDLTKGEEDVKISWVNETTNDFAPPFNYIPQNLVFQDAYVCISLSHIGGEDCCSTCMGNCILSSTPCACANKTGSGFAYTAQGLLKEELLEECIAISHNPQQNFFYCKDCPLERSKNDGCLEPCKGHLKRKFIKECWSKCGCGKQCGNRVIQRGITCNLQVFFTSEGKGWGLRTLEDLPKGAFVCEFVGEILTIKELQERNLKCNENGKYTYPVLLDANWDSGHVKDEEALCLDAASFGNTARFINHRCFDANLVEIPVEVEDPSHYYYHFAFFTSRKIAAREELTWCLVNSYINISDYGIDFDDHDHLVKLFQCRCGSKFCRNMKRSNSKFNLQLLGHWKFLFTFHHDKCGLSTFLWTLSILMLWPSPLCCNICCGLFISCFRATSPQ